MIGRASSITYVSNNSTHEKKSTALQGATDTLLPLDGHKNFVGINIAPKHGQNMKFGNIGGLLAQFKT
ncbi:hypothetical protein ADIAG_00636 [Paeniglutamicibacter gangotriensis Lz1y]|uniref:Uncharacterized protein n=1 Tax=Paeniglutamicibacter gangotriensis Lz1y TaxID=1276920 RepID=M7MWT9_9MICC|nr:hypothetical protein ADIAG_00636 [Paeniglutamicibacter gangotriensis Lz1y]